MFRSGLLGLLVVGLSLMSCSADFGDPAQARLNCPPADSDGAITAMLANEAMTIDGILAESSWTSARSITFQNISRSDNTVEVKVIWNDDGVHLAYVVVDSQVEAGDSAANKNDGSQIFFDVAHDATPEMNDDDIRIVVDIDGGIEGPLLPNATQSSAAGYVTEFLVPWSELGGIPPADTVMGVLFANNDRDEGERIQFDWRELIESGPYARPNLWGDIHLSAALSDGFCP